MKSLQKIASMVGNTYLYKKDNYTIKTYIPEENQVRLKTDSKDIVLLHDGIEHQLEYFLEVEQENTALQAAQTTQADSTLTELNSIMMDTIRKVQHDKEYVAQATAVTKGVTSITNLLKAQLEMMKMANGK